MLDFVVCDVASRVFLVVVPLSCLSSLVGVVFSICGVCWCCLVASQVLWLCLLFFPLLCLMFGLSCSTVSCGLWLVLSCRCFPGCLNYCSLCGVKKNDCVGHLNFVNFAISFSFGWCAASAMVFVISCLFLSCAVGCCEVSVACPCFVLDRLWARDLQCVCVCGGCVVRVCVLDALHDLDLFVRADGLVVVLTDWLGRADGLVGAG